LSLCLQDPLANLLGAGDPAAAPAAAAATVPVFSQEGLSISFAVTPLAGQPGAVDITATYSNDGLDDVADFNLQVRGSAAPVNDPASIAVLGNHCSKCSSSKHSCKARWVNGRLFTCV
jgi:hypothetical protein